jgi:hypothetical protein
VVWYACNGVAVHAASRAPLNKSFGVIGVLAVIESLYEPKEGVAMITAVVQFKLPQPVTREKAQEIFVSTAPKYRQTPGLIRKYFLLSEDGGTAGGIYLWKSKKDAAGLYTKEWGNYIREKYGASPSVTYFESPVVVDNVTNEIVSDS